jgi:hypothetical protein
MLSRQNTHDEIWIATGITTTPTLIAPARSPSVLAICVTPSVQTADDQDERIGEVSANFQEFRYEKSYIFLVPVPHYNGTMVPSGTTNLVPPILTPLDRGGWTTHKNTNHYKTCKSIIDSMRSK